MNALTLGEVLRRSTEHLAAKGCESPRVDAELLLGRALDMERIELYMHLDRPLSAGELDDVRELVARRAGREPVQYVLGHSGFRRLTLAVDSRALIPRPETEVVVERCLALLDGQASPRVLDVGTGSGAIALAVSDEHPGARVTGMDASEEALSLARENAEQTGIEVDLVHHDLFQPLPNGGWDLVVSNPPYVSPDELPGLAPEVRDWEPRSALVAEGAVEAVARSAVDVLRARGALVLEVHPNGADATAALLEDLGYGDVEVTRDLAGRDRVVEGKVERRT